MVGWFGFRGLTPQQQPGSYQGGEMMMKSVFWWRKPEHPEETTVRQVTDETCSHIRPLPSPGIELGPQRCEAKWAKARWERRPSSETLYLGYQCQSTVWEHLPSWVAVIVNIGSSSTAFLEAGGAGRSPLNILETSNDLYCNRHGAIMQF